MEIPSKPQLASAFSCGNMKLLYHWPMWVKFSRAVGPVACSTKEDQVIWFVFLSYIAAGSCLFCDELADKCESQVENGQVGNFCLSISNSVTPAGCFLSCSLGHGAEAGKTSASEQGLNLRQLAVGTGWWGRAQHCDGIWNIPRSMQVAWCQGQLLLSFQLVPISLSAVNFPKHKCLQLPCLQLDAPSLRALTRSIFNRSQSGCLN